MASGRECAAALGLITVIPTTVAGIAKLMQHIIALEAADYSWPDDVIDDDSILGDKGKEWFVSLHRNLATMLSGGLRRAA
jgi:hypothetical protein